MHQRKRRLVNDLLVLCEISPGLKSRKRYAGDGSVGGLYGNRDVRFDTALR